MNNMQGAQDEQSSPASVGLSVTTNGEREGTSSPHIFVKNYCIMPINLYCAYTNNIGA